MPSSLRISSGVYTLKTRLRLGLREAREDGLVRARIVRIVWIFMIVYIMFVFIYIDIVDRYEIMNRTVA